MPGSEVEERGRSGQLAPVSFWCGVGLAPLAAVLLLLADGSLLLRVAAVLVVVAVVLIALSIALRRDGDAMRAEAEDVVFDELDAFREDVRNDIGHAVRVAHSSAAEKIVALNDTVEALRGQVDLLRSQLERAIPQASVPRAGEAAHGVAPGPVPGGVLRHTETVQVTTRHTTVVDPNDQMGGGGQQPPGGQTGGRARVPQQRRPERAYHAEPGDEPQHRDHGRQPRQAKYQELPQHPQESWTEHQLGNQRAGRRSDDAAAERERVSEPPRFDREQDHGVRAGQRWAELRDDERGRELRMGERSAAIRSDGSGTEVRIEDRWAQVRHEEPQRASGRPERQPQRGYQEDQWSERGREPERRDDRGRGSRWDGGEHQTDRAWDDHRSTGSGAGRAWERDQPAPAAWDREYGTGRAWEAAESTGRAWEDRSRQEERQYQQQPYSEQPYSEQPYQDRQRDDRQPRGRRSHSRETDDRW